MPTSTALLAELLKSLTAAARQKGWSDAEWARRSGLPKETLCRLRSRSNCDFATFTLLARSLGARFAVQSRSSRTSAEDWRPHGPPFFLAGLAVTLASLASLDRRKYLGLAEELHPGSTEPRVYSRWLAETPLPPSRLLPMLQAALRSAA
jgi:DNA-binding phage protein